MPFLNLSTNLISVNRQFFLPVLPLHPAQVQGAVPGPPAERDAGRLVHHLRVHMQRHHQAGSHVEEPRHGRRPSQRTHVAEQEAGGAQQVQVESEVIFELFHVPIMAM